jgi:hypothetical protein
MVSPQKWWLLGCSIGRWSSSTSASWGRPEFEPGSYQSDEQHSPSLASSCTSLDSVVHLRPLPWLTWKMNPPLDQAVHYHLVGSPPGGLGGCTPVTREVITHHLHNPRKWAPKKCCRILLAETRDSEANSRKQHFIVPAQTQQTHVQRLSPENKGISPYIPLQAGYRSKIKV